LKLPHSGLEIQYSTEYFRLMKDSDPDALYPDIAAPRTLADILAGRDPALDAALRAQPRGIAAGAPRGIAANASRGISANAPRGAR
jgi:hypothetical protein